MVITVVTGPPCAGKTTYVTQHRRQGDIVIDFDAIAQALGSHVTHGHSHHLAEVTAAAWTAAIRRAIDQHHASHSVWIVDSTPRPNRLSTYQAAGARIIHLDADPAELHRRADAGRPPQWHREIDQYIASQAQPQPRQAVTHHGRTAW